MRLLRKIKELITNRGVVAKRGVNLNEGDLGIIYNAALLLDDDGTVLWLGPDRALPKKFNKVSRVQDLSDAIVSPSLVDCHTHLIFAGSRHEEFAKRLEGKSYEQIAASGGGIKSTVSKIEQITEDALYALSKKRILNILSYGTKIIEIKSGYGLSWNEEKKILFVAQRLKKDFEKKAIIKVTFLGAHAFPDWCKTSSQRNQYVDEICEEMLPRVASLGLADACDVFFDRGYFNSRQTRKILLRAKTLGLHIKIHADELADTDGAALAAELRCLSADHLLKSKKENLNKMAKAGVVAVLLPGTAFYLGLPYVDMELIRKSSVTFALATDYNPGSSPCYNLPFIMTLGCTQMGMTMPEAFAAATYGGACALALQENHGHITVGKRPQISIFSVPSYQALISDFAHRGYALSDE